MNEQIMDVKQICNQLGCSESTFMNAVHHEGLPAKKTSGQWQITRAALDKWQKRSAPEKVEEKPKAKKSKGFNKKR